jgi:hypothetical protein
MRFLLHSLVGFFVIRMKSINFKMNTTKTVILKENYKGMPHTIERSQEVKK